MPFGRAQGLHGCTRSGIGGWKLAASFENADPLPEALFLLRRPASRIAPTPRKRSFATRIHSQSAALTLGTRAGPDFTGQHDT